MKHPSGSHMEQTLFDGGHQTLYATVTIKVTDHSPSRWSFMYQIETPEGELVALATHDWPKSIRWKNDAVQDLREVLDLVEYHQRPFG